jgi:hypothetical protein
VGYAITVEVGNGEVGGVIDFKRRRILAFTALFLRLQGIELPVGYVPELEFRPHVMFARNLIDEAWDGGVGDHHPGLSEGIRSPDIGEGTAAAIDPEAGILRIPGTVWIGVGGVGCIVRIETGAIRCIRTVAAQKAYIVQQRVLACVP